MRANVGQTVLKSFLICVVLVFRHGLRAQAFDPSSPRASGINGTYIYLNASSVIHSDLPDCPHNITIHDDAFQQGEGPIYFFNFSAFDISTEDCTYQSENNGFVELGKHTFPSEMNGTLGNYTLWNMTLPEMSLICMKDSSFEMFEMVIPGGNVSFIPFMRVPHKVSSAHGESPMGEVPVGEVPMGEVPVGVKMTTGKSVHLLLFENVETGHLCTFFPQAQYQLIEGFMKLAFGEFLNGFLLDGHPPGRDRDADEFREGEMKIGKGKSLQFCPICSCQATLGSDIDLEEIEMTEDNSTETSETKVDEDVHWRPPKILARGQKCPVSFAKTLEEVISQDTLSEKDDASDMETKDLVLHAVINKLHDEIAGEYQEEWGEMDFEMRKELVVTLMMRSFRWRRLMFMKRGTRCGQTTSTLTTDTIFLYEKKHILWQLEHDPFLLRNSVKAHRIRETERDTDREFTLHVFRKKEEGGFAACVLSNSRSACNLLNSTEFCSSFKPFGSKGLTHDDSSGAIGAPLKPGQGSGNSSGDSGQLPQDGNGTSTDSGEDIPSTEDPDEPQGPAAPTGNQTISPSSVAVQTPGGVPENESPTASTTPVGAPVNQSVTPTPSPTAVSPSPIASSVSNSSSGVCFPAEAEVELENGRVIRMDELNIGDSIQDGTGGYSKVILFTHTNKEIVFEFVRLEAEGAGVVLSAQHYIPVNGKLMTAESVKEGDTIYVMREGHKTEAIVINVERVWMRGLFNPQTVSGSLAVRMNGDSVVVSAYTAGIDANVAHSLLVPLRMLNNFIGIVIRWSWLFKNGWDEIVRILPSGASVVGA